MVWDCLIVGLLWLHHIQSLANITMATIARNLLWGKNDIKLYYFKQMSYVGKVGELVLPRTSR
jgi:hypothetical protein